jgi:ribosome biogenesis GTPase
MQPDARGEFRRVRHKPAVARPRVFYGNTMAEFTLATLGWNDSFQDKLEAARKASGVTDAVPARVAANFGASLKLYAESGELEGLLSGRMMYGLDAASLPATGDWVLCSPLDGEPRAIVHAVLPRKNRFSRKSAGDSSGEQLIAANLDRLFIVQSLDANFNLRRLERYLSAAFAADIPATILLNKADLPDAQAEKRRDAARAVAAGADVVSLSAFDAETVRRALAGYLPPGATVAFVGSSGVGKSSLINALLGEERQETSAVRASDSRGRHTTTRRDLLLAPDGYLVIDSPGMREFAPFDAESGIETLFADVLEFAVDCRFADCTHAEEPGCAVQAALADGRLDRARFESYERLLREEAALQARLDPELARERRQQWKAIHKSLRLHYRARERGEA